MKRFFRDLLLFLSPFAVLFGIPFCVLLQTGELEPVASVAALQADSGQPILFGPVYSNLSKRFKLESAIRRQPSVLILGSSRVMQFRSEFFLEPERVYNAGGGVSDIKHFRMFLDSLPASRMPSMVILGLDQYYFNPNWSNAVEGDIQPRMPAWRSGWEIFISSWKTTYVDLFSGKLPPEILLAPHEGRVGVNAILQGNGFRRDGSYHYASKIAEFTQGREKESGDYGFQETLSRIERGDSRFEYADSVSAEALNELDSLLAFCKARNIHAVGFHPPYPHAVLQKMIDLGKYGYLQALFSGTGPIFARYGFQAFDFTDLAELGASDAETVDGLHGSEVAYAKLLRAMSAKDTVMGRAVSPDRLGVLLAGAPNPWEAVRSGF